MGNRLKQLALVLVGIAAVGVIASGLTTVVGKPPLWLPLSAAAALVVGSILYLFGRVVGGESLSEDSPRSASVQAWIGAIILIASIAIAIIGVVRFSDDDASIGTTRIIVAVVGVGIGTVGLWRGVSRLRRGHAPEA